MTSMSIIIDKHNGKLRAQVKYRKFYLCQNVTTPTTWWIFVDFDSHCEAEHFHIKNPWSISRKNIYQVGEGLIFVIQYLCLYKQIHYNQQLFNNISPLGRYDGPERALVCVVGRSVVICRWYLHACMFVPNYLRPTIFSKARHCFN